MREKSSADLKAAVKADDKRRVETIRIIMAALRDKEIDTRGRSSTLK